MVVYDFFCFENCCVLLGNALCCVGFSVMRPRGFRGLCGNGVVYIFIEKMYGSY